VLNIVRKEYKKSPQKIVEKKTKNNLIAAGGAVVILRLHLVCGGELGGEGGAAPVLHAVGVQQVQQQLRIAAVRTTAFHPTTSCSRLLACSAKECPNCWKPPCVWKIRLKESSAKNLPVKGLCGGCFICLRPPPHLWPNSPPPLYTLFTCIQYRATIREKVRGAIVHKDGRKYQYDWIYLQSINSNKHQ
jgi:hypothetical protein